MQGADSRPTVPNSMGTVELVPILSSPEVRRKTLPYLIGIPAFAVICISLIWIAVSARLSAERKANIDTAGREVEQLAESYAEQLARTVDGIDRHTRNLAYFWNHSKGKLRLEQRQRHHADEVDDHPATNGFAVGIADRTGRLVTSWPSQPVGTDIADKAHFIAHRSGRAGHTSMHYLDHVRITGKPAVVFSHALTRHGSFDGLVYTAVEPQLFASFYMPAKQGNGDVLCVVTSNGTIVASRSASGSMQYPNGTFAPFVFESRSGTQELAGEIFADGQARLVAWRSLPNDGLVAVASRQMEDIHLPYRAIESSYMHVALAATALLAAGAVLGLYFATIMVWRRHQADTVAATYRLATDNAKECFFMARAIHGRGNTIHDFVIEDCNQRGAELLQMDKEDIKGATVQQLFPPERAKKIVEVGLCAMETGFYEDEIAFTGAGSVGSKGWLYRRITRLGDGLAVTLRDITEGKAHQQALVNLASSDPLTGLPNRHWLNQYLPKALAQARQLGTRLAVLFIDLDNFKHINNTYGHAAGDRLLQMVAERMRASLRSTEHIVRLGGDEFTILIDLLPSIKEAEQVASRLHACFKEPFPVAGAASHHVMASIGMSIYPDHGTDMTELLQDADIAMYKAKAEGKGRWRTYTPGLSEEILTRASKEQALRRAISQDELILHYQPRVSAMTGEVLSLEALIRWQCPDIGLIPPSEFIPLAEEIGVIGEIGNMVLDKACKQIALWRSAGFNELRVSVNASASQFDDGLFCSHVTTMLRRYQVPSSCLEVEITETCMMEHSEHINEQLAALKACGVRVAIDDFGTGYSSLSQLQRLDLDVLKIDRSFTASLFSGRNGEAFFKTILSLAQMLGMDVVAEGVETADQLRALQAMGCNEVQGYYVSRPVTAQLATELLTRRYLFQEPADNVGLSSSSRQGL